ncbi:serine/threonine-protein kinase [Marinobacter sp. chi1]|uniref:Serine/threonine-protein kinase n=1 Tax=Marinobacter suaedae TaxID=3057675 RepID=A0ABT8VW61_9GAMM|nr:serine/threonine-protein kinase [Marinobacter sp. chi1]MDO3720188.1 serine/threonine-protein kinase [Marinobacter sp. chi1]
MTDKKKAPDDTDETRLKKQREERPAKDETEEPTVFVSSDDTFSDSTRVDPPDARTVMVSEIAGLQGGLVDDRTYLNSSGKSAYPVLSDFPISPGIVIRDRFELVEELGSGGMGSVYRAIDRRKLEADDENPYVAIKLLSDDFKAHPKALVTLQREAKKTQALAHPNIVTVYDFDRDGDLVFMTMEELRGQTLEDLMNEKSGMPFERRRGLSIIKGIAKGLIYAHKRGVIHSDLKPGNIFVTESGELKILDFGIARLLDESSLSDRFDVSELSAVTPRYASLEMLEHGEPDVRDDIFSLGVMACEILGGSHPYQRRTAAAALEGDIKPKLPTVGRLLRKALARAVTLKKTDRVRSVEKWLSQIEFAAGGYRKWFYGVFAALIALGLSLNYIGQITETQVALSELSKEQQEKFATNIDEANVALSFSDVNGALFYLDKAYTIHSQNEQVSDLIADIIESLQQVIEVQKLDQSEVDDLIQTLREYPAFQNDNVRDELESLRASKSG